LPRSKKKDSVGRDIRYRAFLCGETMVIFKCPYTAHLSFKQRSYAKCQVCNETMYSWNSRNVPIFTLMNASKGETPDIQP
jgi:hypothetical protein